MLKFIVPDKTEFEALNPATQALYEEDGAGRYVLKVEGAVPKKQLDDFRQTNIDLRKQVEAFGDITADEAKTLKAKKSEFEAGNDPKKIDDLVNARVEAMKTAHQTELDKIRNDNATLTGKLSEHVIDSALIDAGTKAGLRSTAIDDLVARGRKIFKLGEDGESLVATDAEGNPVYGPSGEKLNPTAWVSKLSKEASHLFEPSKGGGSENQGTGKGGQGSGGANPFAKATWNLTEQGLAIRADKEAARTMAAAAGVTLNI